MLLLPLKTDKHSILSQQELSLKRGEKVARNNIKKDIKRDISYYVEGKGKLERMQEEKSLYETTTLSTMEESNQKARVRKMSLNPLKQELSLKRGEKVERNNIKKDIKRDISYYVEGKGKLERMQEEKSLYETTTLSVMEESNQKKTFVKKIVNPMKKKEKNVVSDEIFSDMVLFIVKQKKASISMLQKHFQIGYNKAKSVICDMEQMGIISQADGKKPRAVLMTFEEWQEKKS